MVPSFSCHSKILAVPAFAGEVPFALIQMPLFEAWIALQPLRFVVSLHVPVHRLGTHAAEKIKPLAGDQQQKFRWASVKVTAPEPRCFGAHPLPGVKTQPPLGRTSACGRQQAMARLGEG